MLRVRGATSVFAATVLLLASASPADERAYPSPEAVRPLTPGTAVPSTRVETAAGEPVDLADLVRDRGALLVFYRGGW